MNGGEPTANLVADEPVGFEKITGPSWRPKVQEYYTEGHFTHETESLWPLHFKHSHWWKRRSWSKFISHYAWGTNGVRECKMDVKSTWILTWHWMDYVSWLLGLFSYHLLEIGLTQSREIMALSNAHNCWFILFYHAWGSARIQIHWNSIWFRDRSHMTSHYTWGSVTIVHDFGASMTHSRGISYH